MRAYYFDNIPGDQRLAHDYVPSRPVSEETLSNICLKHWYIPVEGHQPKVDEVAQTQGYKNRDTINVSKAGLGEAYEIKIKGFFEEHMHEDEEIRYILEGSGFFDVRECPSDAWIRLAVAPGDLIVLPAGIYHRFTLDEKNNIKALRLFKDEPKWIPYNRSSETDTNPYRKDYLQSIECVELREKSLYSDELRELRTSILVPNVQHVTYNKPDITVLSSPGISQKLQPLRVKLSVSLPFTLMSSLYAAKKKQPETYKTEFDILKASHKFLRSGNGDEPKSWEAQLAKKYEDTLFKEFAVCNLKHYKSGNIALRWRTEDEVLSGAGELSCGNTRCPYHDDPAASRSQDACGGSRQLPKPPKLTAMELPFSYVEQGETQVREVMVKVVLCERCVKKSMWRREKKARQEPASDSRGSISETRAVLDSHATGSSSRNRAVRSHRDRNEGPGGRRSRTRSMSPLRRPHNRTHIDPDNSVNHVNP